MLLCGGDDEVAVLVAHSTRYLCSVREVEQGNVGIDDRLFLTVYDSSDEFVARLLYGLDEDETVAHHFHRDGIESNTLLDGFWDTEMLETFRNGIVLQFVVDERNLIVAGGTT